MIGEIFQSGWKTKRSLLVIVAIVSISGTSWFAFGHRSNHKIEYNGQSIRLLASNQQALQASPLIYSSPQEGATFSYQNNWTMDRSSAATRSASNDATDNDEATMASPSRAVNVSWVTNIVGFGNEHTSTYPLITVVDKTPISGAPSYFVVSGITTLDGTTYHPWLAVQDANGILTSGVQGDLVTFTARRALNPTTNRQTRMLFATCGPHSVDNSPALTQAQATAWFSGSEAQQAKQILLSFSDPQ